MRRERGGALHIVRQRNLKYMGTRCVRILSTVRGHHTGSNEPRLWRLLHPRLLLFQVPNWMAPMRVSNSQSTESTQEHRWKQAWPRHSHPTASTSTPRCPQQKPSWRREAPDSGPSKCAPRARGSSWRAWGSRAMQVLHMHMLVRPHTTSSTLAYSRHPIAYPSHGAVSTLQVAHDSLLECKIMP